DADGKYDGEFPRLSFKAAQVELLRNKEILVSSETSYKAALKDRLDGNRSEELISILRQPLRLATADHQEQLAPAGAEVRRAEAELIAAENESVASELEHAASELIYAAMQTETERRKALVEIDKIGVDVRKAQREADELGVKVAEGGIEEAEN